MKELKCPNCGGPLASNGFGKYHCEYCNSKFQEIEYGELRLIQIGQPHCKIIEAYTSIPNYIFYDAKKYNDLDTIKKSITKDLTEQLANALIKYITINETYDVVNDERIFRGQLRIVNPEYKY